jgi:hypothetical protein
LSSLPFFRAGASKGKAAGEAYEWLPTQDHEIQIILLGKFDGVPNRLDRQTALFSKINIFRILLLVGLKAPPEAKSG